MSQAGNFTTISAAIVNVLQNIQQEGSDAFVEIVEYPTVESTDGYPLATVSPSDSPSTYLTTVQNLRSYTFHIDILVPLGTDNGGYESAFSQGRILVDSVLDAVDNSNSLDGTGQIVVPAPSTWSVVQSSVGALLDCLVTVTAKVSVDQDNG
jgi:hypothetical protein